MPVKQNKETISSIRVTHVLQKVNEDWIEIIVSLTLTMYIGVPGLGTSAVT